MDHLYPPGPANVPAAMARPSKRYKRQAWLAVASLAVFLLLYILLAAWFGYTAWRLWAAVFAGADQALMLCAMGSCAGFLTVFMLKALWFKQRGGDPRAVEVTADELPLLFDFLYRLADEAGAPRPAKVFLSREVNARVFYNVSLFNLIYSSRKNLEIGLALVNVLTLSELKAVLAHEFGHFAQRTMAIGSWVYIAQQIAGQIIHKRDALDDLLNALSRFDVRVAWVGWCLSLVVWGIRSITDSMFRLALLAQRALSRQMEFQADLVAVSLTGSDELVHALHKLKAADQAWEQALRLGYEQVQQGHQIEDLFELQSQIIQRIGQILNDADYGRVPVMAGTTPAAHRVFARSFAQPPQMWSTHPANADRESNAKQIYLSAPHDARSAWQLFDNVSAIKAKVLADVFGKHEAMPATAGQTAAALESWYGLARYDTRFRGSYLHRTLCLHADTPQALYASVSSQDTMQTGLAALYPASLSDDLQSLRDLEEEQALLQAIYDKRFKPAGDAILFRGRTLAPKELPATIAAVSAEAEQVRQGILAHDVRCRSAHLALAQAVGGGWYEYLLGLIDTLHYAEHTLADLRDAHGALCNVMNVLTANRRVRNSELPRLLKSANELRRVLQGVYWPASDVQLDRSLLARLEVASWAEMLGNFTLSSATSDNISNWMGVIDGWVNDASRALSGLMYSTLEQLLLSETRLAQTHGPFEQAPARSKIPVEYPRLLTGQQRQRQTRLSAWDRFRVADGPVAAIGRFLVAGTIVGGVLGFGSTVNTVRELDIYNGLDRAVVVDMLGQHVPVDAGGHAVVNVPLAASRDVETRTEDGQLIEALKPGDNNPPGHLIYNVAGASPLVQWAAVYGDYPKSDPVALGNPTWTDSVADVFFTEPPASVHMSDGTRGEQRLVVSGMGQATPDIQLGYLKSEAEKNQLIQAHVKWDKPGTLTYARWQALAHRVPTP